MIPLSPSKQNRSVVLELVRVITPVRERLRECTGRPVGAHYVLFPEMVSFTFFLHINYFVSLILNSIHSLHVYDYFVKCMKLYIYHV